VEEAEDVAPDLLPAQGGGNAVSHEKDFDRPSQHGAILGAALSSIADAGDAPHIPDRCLTCAFTKGTMPNQCAGTVTQVLDCTVHLAGLFYCHHGIKDGEPKRVCAGYMAAVEAPYRFAMKAIGEAHRQLLGLTDEVSDAIRADFDAWYAKVDPDGKMDSYQLARAYEMRCRAP
jgi:hypothetical protein